jgi:hypothetical protein
LCNQDPLGIAKAEPKQNLDNQAQTEFVDTANTQESERMVLRHATTSELGSGSGGEVGRGRRVKQYVATLSQEPRRLDARYKFIFPRHTSFTPLQNNRKTLVLYALIFIFLDIKLEDKRFCTE